MRPAAGRSPESRFCGGAARVSPDFTVNGAPEAKSGGAWVWDKLRDTSKPPRAKAGLGKARGERINSGADLHDGASPARAFRSKRGLKVYDI
jgi:hypothetical protein